MRTFGIAALLLGAAGPAVAVSAVSSAIVMVDNLGGNAFALHHSGFGDDGVATGSFTAVDLNGDGQISSRDNEVQAFSLTFNGTSGVEPLSFVFEDLGALVYDLDSDIGDGLSGDVEGIAVFNSSSAFYLAGAHAFRPCGDGTTCAMIEDGARALVPAPAPLALLIPAAALVALRRRVRA